MRGAPLVVGRPIYPHRIIPADAGSTHHRSKRIVNFRDHPRGCGEHAPRDAEKLSRRGSSPRMRGALSLFLIWSSATRIIPADAGSTMCLDMGMLIL